MAWYRQATSHYLSQCWPRSMSPYGIARPQWVNSLAPGRCGSIFLSIIHEHVLQIIFMKTSCKIAPRWMPQNTCEDIDGLVHERCNSSALAMEFSLSCINPLICQHWFKLWLDAWCHYLSQYWSSLMSPYDMTRPQWVKVLLVLNQEYSGRKKSILLLLMPWSLP